MLLLLLLLLLLLRLRLLVVADLFWDLFLSKSRPVLSVPPFGSFWQVV